MPVIKHPIKLEEQERDFLNKHIRSGNWTPRQVTRARILLLADIDGPHQYIDKKISKELQCSQATVFNTRKRFSLQGSIEDTLFDKPRPGRPKLVDGVIDAHMTTIACSTPPEGHAKWTLRMIKNRLITLEVVEKISHMTVGRALKKKK